MSEAHEQSHIIASNSVKGASERLWSFPSYIIQRAPSPQVTDIERHLRGVPALSQIGGASRGVNVSSILHLDSQALDRGHRGDREQTLNAPKSVSAF